MAHLVVTAFVEEYQVIPLTHDKAIVLIIFICQNATNEISSQSGVGYWEGLF